MTPPRLILGLLALLVAILATGRAWAANSGEFSLEGRWLPTARKSASLNSTYDAAMVLSSRIRLSLIGFELDLPWVHARTLSGKPPELRSDSARVAMSLGVHRGFLEPSPGLTLEDLNVHLGIRSPQAVAGSEAELWKDWKTEVGTTVGISLANLFRVHLRGILLSSLLANNTVEVEGVQLVFDVGDARSLELTLSAIPLPELQPELLLGVLSLEKARINTEMSEHTLSLPLHTYAEARLRMERQEGETSWGLALGYNLPLAEEEAENEGFGELLSGTHTLIPFAESISLELFGRL